MREEEKPQPEMGTIKKTKLRMTLPAQEMLSSIRGEKGRHKGGGLDSEGRTEKTGCSRAAVPVLAR